MRREIAYAIRVLIKQPGFTVIAMLTLALGIGADTAIFSVFDAVVLRPLGYPDEGRLLRIYGTDPDRRELSNVSPLDFLDWGERAGSFESLGAFASQELTWIEGDEPRRLQGLQVTPGYLETLGVTPALGGGFSGEDGEAGAARRVVLAHGFWISALGGDPEVVGRALAFDEGPAEVLGVMPAGFSSPGYGPGDVAFWANLAIDPARHGRGGHWLRAVARLRPGVSAAAAQGEMDAIMLALAEEHPSTNTDERVELIPLRTSIVGEVRPVLLVLLGAVACVLLIACTNVANLQLARAASRRQEIAVRRALGATRVRLMRQLLTESLVLAVAGGLAGLALASWAVDLLVALMPGDLPRGDAVGINLRILGFAFLLSLLTGVLVGCLPAWRASRADLRGALQEGARGTPDVRQQRARNGLVVAQVALALVLLAGAGMFLRSFQALRRVDPGFRSEGVLTFQVSLPRSRYREPLERHRFFRDALGRLAALPEVAVAGAINARPLSGEYSCDWFSLEDLGPFPVEGHPCTDSRVVTGDYFEAMGIPLLRGRGFEARDAADDAPLVVVISDAMAQRYFPGADPIGRRFKWGPWSSEDPWRTIVGVTGNVRHFGLDREPAREVYMPHRQHPFASTFTVALRARGAAAALLPSARAVVREMDPRLPLDRVATLDAVVAGSVASERFQTLLVASFATLAVALAVVGVFGVISYAMGRRVREIGVRMAMGAGRGDIYAMVLSQAGGLAVIGIAAGLAGALLAGRLLGPLLFGVGAVDLPSLVIAPLMLAALVVAGCLLPARRAARINPIRALREE